MQLPRMSRFARYSFPCTFCTSFYWCLARRRTPLEHAKSVSIQKSSPISTCSSFWPTLASVCSMLRITWCNGTSRSVILIWMTKIAMLSSPMKLGADSMFASYSKLRASDSNASSHGLLSWQLWHSVSSFGSWKKVITPQLAALQMVIIGSSQTVAPDS